MDQLVIRDLFKLSNGVTVLAVDRPAGQIAWRDRRVSLANGAGTRSPFTLRGESLMFGRSSHQDQVAVETNETVDLSPAEAQSGEWRLGFS